MHTKWVLLAIVLLNIVDCVLVMGELILDIYYLKGSFVIIFLCIIFIIVLCINSNLWILHGL